MHNNCVYTCTKSGELVLHQRVKISEAGGDYDHFRATETWQLSPLEKREDISKLEDIYSQTKVYIEVSRHFGCNFWSLFEAISPLIGGYGRLYCLMSWRIFLVCRKQPSF
mgnify:CR=1 FL=1